MTAGENIALTIQTFVGKVMSLSSFIIAFLPGSKGLFISWLQLPSAVILKPKKIKSVSASTFPLLFSMKWWEDCSSHTSVHPVVLKVIHRLAFSASLYWTSFSNNRELCGILTGPIPAPLPSTLESHWKPGSRALQVDSLLTDLWGKTVCPH